MMFTQFGRHPYILSGVVTCIFALLLLDRGLCLDEHCAFFVLVYWYFKRCLPKSICRFKVIKNNKGERQREIERGMLN